MLDFDHVLLEIGEFGRYQRFVVLLLIVPACFMNAYNSFGLVMLTYTPKHRCASPLSTVNSTSAMNYSSVSYERCSVNYFFDGQSEPALTEPCQQWTYDKDIFDETLITRFNLVCDRAIISKNIVAIMQVSSIVGCFLSAYIQDTFGRKMAFIFIVSTYVFGGVTSVFMPSVTTFIIARSFAAMHTISGWNISYIWALEYVGPSKRTLVTTVYCTVYGIGMMTLAGWAYVLRDWQHLGVAISAPFILLLSYCYLVHESPRWLLGAGKYDRCRAVIKTINKWEQSNKKSRKTSLAALDDVITRLHAEQMEENPDFDGSTDTTATYLDLFRGANLRMKTVLITFCWVANALVYTTIAYNTENIGDNLLVTWTLTAAVEAPATISNLLVLNRYGRVLPMVSGMIIAGLCCIGTAPGSAAGVWFVVFLTMVGKFFISMTFGIICQLAGELYPTVARGVGTGLSATFGLLGQTTMPYIVHAAAAYKFLPMVVIGIVAIIGGCTSLFLPETLGQSMPQTLADAESHGNVGTGAFRGHCHRLKLILTCRDLSKDKNTVLQCTEEEEANEAEAADAML
uniref:Major facilitator superfamily (MFS) profile domain-containing protein n=1 Tax=Plectus sambesii TaxID=2011161 RepID=A0A914X4I0_9BILA